MDLIIGGFASIASVYIIFLIFAGVFLGIIFGAVPGISVTMGVALFLPITYGMEPIHGLALLMGLYVGGISGGLISAALLNIPGTASSIATCLDGHPMVERGEAGKALGVGILFSFLGGIFSAIVLMFIAPWLATFTIKFSFYEYFAVAFFSLTLISSLSGKNIWKGFLACAAGIALSFVGIQSTSGATRFTFGFSQLTGGFSLLPALIGLFAVSQVLDAALCANKKEEVVVQDYHMHGFGITMKEFIGQIPNAFRSALIGTGIGILPGLGGGICNIISYTVAKNRSAYPEKFGTGIIDGLVASETSNNASTGGAMVPLMTLGVPGDNTTAILLAGFTLHGIVPGPLLFSSSSDLVYAVFAAIIVANVFMLVVEFFGLNIFARVLTIPKNILLPMVMVFCLIGAYGNNNRIFDIWTMLFFGVIGFIMNKVSLPTAPLLLGFILASTLEDNLLNGLQRTNGDFLPFLTSPISGTILAVTFIVIIFNIRKAIIGRRKLVKE